MKLQSRSNRLSLVLMSVLLLPATLSHAGQTTRVSVDSAGGEGDNASYYPKINADGRYVAFISDASNLVPGDANGMADIFVYDRQAATMTRATVNSTGGDGDGSSSEPALSADGLTIAFVSHSTNLVPGDTNGQFDAFVRDLTTGQTTLVSVSSAGVQGNGDSGSWDTSISANGRYVAFGSTSTNLVPADTNDITDVFIRDRQTGKTTRVSLDSAGGQSNDESSNPSISGDGRYVAYESGASNLVLDDTNAAWDVFVYDRNTGITTRASVDSAGAEGNDSSYNPAISANGRYVVFQSQASNLVPGDGNAEVDVFVRDLTTGTTSRVSVDSAGVEANGRSGGLHVAISADGRYVGFGSQASNLVPGDANGMSDTFLHDRKTGKTTLVSVDSAGVQGNADSYYVSVSADGRYVAFGSLASNLVTGDANATSDIFVRDRLLMIYPHADLGLDVTIKPVSTAKGDFANYTFTVTNNGPDSASEVTLIDVGSKAPWSVTPSQGGCITSVVTVCRFGTLASGASATLNVVMKPNLNPLTQQLTVSAKQVDNAPANNSATVSTPVTP